MAGAGKPYFKDAVESHILLAALGKLQRGSLHCSFPNGEEKTYYGTDRGVDADIVIYDWRVLDRLITDNDVGFGEDYSAGLWDSSNLTTLQNLLLDNIEELEAFIYGQRFHQYAAHFLKAKFRANTLHGSRQNIHEHYDLGNDFYSLWLDDSFTYSSALFEGDKRRSLEQAQLAKYERILTKLNATSGDHVLEIGCGWGGFSEVTARNGLKVTSVTISEEQYNFANQRMSQLELSNAEIRLQDYREVAEKFDYVVSIGMFEHVGEEFWPTYMTNVYDRLRASGRAVIQTITIRDDLFDAYRGSTDFLRKHIFPGGMLPTEKRFRKEAENVGFEVTDVFHFGQDYALTLEHWHQRFEVAIDDVRKLGFSDQFIRKWRFYLNGCEAAFRAGRISVMQVTLEKT